MQTLLAATAEAPRDRTWLVLAAHPVEVLSLTRLCSPSLITAG